RLFEHGPQGFDAIDEGVGKLVGEGHVPRAPGALVRRKRPVACHDLRRLTGGCGDRLQNLMALALVQESFPDDEPEIIEGTGAWHAPRCYDGSEGAAGVPGGGAVGGCRGYEGGDGGPASRLRTMKAVPRIATAPPRPMPTSRAPPAMPTRNISAKPKPTTTIPRDMERPRTTASRGWCGRSTSRPDISGEGMRPRSIIARRSVCLSSSTFVR